MSNASIMRLGNDHPVKKLFNIRGWLKDAIERQGVEIEGAGLCWPDADFDFTLGGRHYWLKVT
jgi:hypothetical protein